MSKDFKDCSPLRKALRRIFYVAVPVETLLAFIDDRCTTFKDMPFQFYWGLAVSRAEARMGIVYDLYAIDLQAQDITDCEEK